MITNWLRVGLVVACIPIIAAGCVGELTAMSDGSLPPGTIDVISAHRASNNGDTLLIDIREAYEIEWGAPDKASERFVYRMDRSRDNQFVEETLRAVSGNRSANINIICATGVRSKRARILLATHGFTNVKSVSGGVEAWRAMRLPSRQGHGSLNGTIVQ